uniref:Transthyretin-like family protein n=1 Tax=Caenorhabditis japonica TaxID=281687 RepID=K7I765_CAEJA
MQNVTVKGTVLCNKRRVPNLQVDLYERDINVIIDPHDKLGSVLTNEVGDFEVFGKEDEIFTIEPFLKIHHTCNAKPGCEHISEYVVPKEKIGGIYDMTFISLEAVSAKDTVKCP